MTSLLPKSDVEILDAAIQLRVVYNPFNPEDFQAAELEFQRGKVLAHYLQGLPSPESWLVGLNGVPVKTEEYETLCPVAGDMLTLVHTPEGGDGGAKDIIRLIALITLAIFAPQLAAMWLPAGLDVGITAAVASAAITVGGAMIINALLPPPKPTFDDDQSQQTYGADGPKNTARPGAAVPVVYGQYRYGGNIIDLFTKQEGDDQYLYMRTVLNDGEIDSISAVEINDQPYENYYHVQQRLTYGLETEEKNDWFNNTIRLVNRNVQITGTPLIHQTDGEVDKLRIDILAPGGIVHFDPDDEGHARRHWVDLTVEYREIGSPTWLGLPLSQWIDFSTNSPANTTKLQIEAKAQPTLFESQQQSVNMQVQYRLAGSGGAWTTMGFVDTAQQYTIPDPITRFAYLNASIPIGEVTTTVRTYEAEVPAGVYEVRAVNGTITASRAYAFASSTSNFRLTGESTKAIRKSIETGTLPRAAYEIRVSRTTAPSTTSEYVDAVYVTDVGEIDLSNVRYNGAATLSHRIKMGEQINGIPVITALVKGCKLKEYDEVGNFVIERWGNNPAWIALDILTNPLRGAAISLTRFDWDSWYEWAQFCEAEGLEFNGVFDSTTNIYDALSQVFRVGRAMPIRIGLRYGVAIDRADTPIMEFNSSNMHKDTFQVGWTSMEARANEVELTYYDRDDGFKQKTIRLTDPTIALPGETRRVSSFSQIGITSTTQATAEAEMQLRRNKLLRKTASFDVPVEAIGVRFGDVVLVHHEAADFANGKGGRLESGSTTTVLKLDREVTLAADTDYKALVYLQPFKRYDVTIESIVGSNVYVSGLPSGDIDVVHRLKQGGTDVEVINIYETSPHDRVVVQDTDGLVTGPAELWITHVIEERDIDTGAGTHSQVTLESALTVAPEQYAHFIIGRTDSVKQLYRVMGLSGEDPNRRTLSLINYSDNQYLPAGTDLPPPVIVPVIMPDQVTDLSIVYNPTAIGTTVRHFVDISWNVPDFTNYGGADVYVNNNNTGWRKVQSVVDVTSIRFEALTGYHHQFRVVGYNKVGRRASVNDAPTIQFAFTVSALEVPSITVEAESVTGPFSSIPAIVVAWNTPSDGRVEKIRIEVTKTSGGDPIVAERDADEADDHVLLISEGLVENTEYSVRARFESVEYRSEWCTPEIVTTPSDYIVPSAHAPAPNGQIDRALNEALESTFPGFAITGGHGDLQFEANVTNPADVKVLPGYFDHPILGEITVTETTFRTPWGNIFAPRNGFFAIVWSEEAVSTRFTIPAGSGHFFPAVREDGIWKTYSLDRNYGETFTPELTDVVVARGIKPLKDGSAYLSTSNTITEVESLIRDTTVVNSRFETIEAVLGDVGDPDNPAGSIFARYNHLTTALASEEAARVSDVITLTANLATANANISTNTTAIATEASARASADSTLTANLATANANISTNSTAIATEASARASADSTLTANLATANANIATNSTAIATESAARSSADSTLTANLATANANIATNATAIATESSARASADSTLTASVGSNTSTINTIQSALASGGVNQALLAFLVNTTTNAASLKLISTSGGTWNGSIIELAADYIRLVAKNIYFGTSTTYNDTYKCLVTIIGSYRLMMLGPFGASSDLVIWYGLNSVTLGTETVANAVMAFASDGEIYKSGGAVQTMFVQISPSSLQVQGVRTGAGSVTTAAASVSDVLGGNGAYTYSWTYVSGDTFTINSPTSASTTATTSVTVSQIKTGVYRCTVTDTATGRTAYRNVTFRGVENT